MVLSFSDMQDISQDIHHQQYSKKNDFHNTCKYNYYNPIIITYTASDIDLDMDYNQLQDNIIL